MVLCMCPLQTNSKTIKKTILTIYYILKQERKLTMFIIIRLKNWIIKLKAVQIWEIVFAMLLEVWIKKNKCISIFSDINWNKHHQLNIKHIFLQLYLQFNQPLLPILLLLYKIVHALFWKQFAKQKFIL